MIDKKILQALLKKVKTPFYVYDAQIIRENCSKLKNAFSKYYPDTEIHYAVKANNCPEVLRIIKKAGLGVDCSSPFELLISQKTGFKRSAIMYTGNYESPEDLDFALKYAGLINLDDISSFYRIKDISLPEIVSFRINPGIGKGGFEGITTGGVDAKFGIPYEKALEAYKTAFRSGARRFGIHMMTGSNNLEPLYFAEITDKLMHIAGSIFSSLGGTPEYIDIGGGFGIPYTDDEVPLDIERTAELVCERFKANCSKFKFGNPVLRIEPGRYITGNAGVLVTKVTGKKDSYRNYTGVDAGMNTLIRPALYNAFHRMETPFKKRTGHLKTDVCGRICENSDIFCRNIPLPLLDEGDIIVFRDSGAYGSTMSSNYNGRPRPGEIVTDSGKITYLKERESLEKMVALHYEQDEQKP